MPHHPAITAPFVRPPQLYLRGEYEGLAQALADVTALQSNTALEYCSSEQLADAPSETQLRALFESLDTDKDGYIDVPELRASKVTSLDPASMLRLADRNADSRISFAEFKDAFGGSQIGERATQKALWSMIGREPQRFVSGLTSDEPSFTRLFTHETWRAYTGRPILTRWLVILRTWRYSTVLRAVYPVSALASIWAYAVASLPRALLPRTSPVPMSLMGTALGLLLVFRTNNSYLRLAEARALWSTMLCAVRALAQGVATALLWDERHAKSEEARDSAARVCRYLACFAWELRARLMGGQAADNASASIRNALLSPEEASFVGGCRLRPATIVGAIRRELHDQYTRSWLDAHIHRRLEEHVGELERVVSSCERIFSSPLPPTLSRHIVRCLQLWLIGFPFVLAGTMAPLSVALWVFATSYAFVGIDDAGQQVEQPFDLMPMNKLCLFATQTLDETFVRMPPGMRERQQQQS